MLLLSTTTILGLHGSIHFELPNAALIALIYSLHTRPLQFVRLKLEPQPFVTTPQPPPEEVHRHEFHQLSSANCWKHTSSKTSQHPGLSSANTNTDYLHAERKTRSKAQQTATIPPLRMSQPSVYLRRMHELIPPLESLARPSPLPLSTSDLPRSTF